MQVIISGVLAIALYRITRTVSSLEKVSLNKCFICIHIIGVVISGLSGLVLAYFQYADIQTHFKETCDPKTFDSDKHDWCDVLVKCKADYALELIFEIYGTCQYLLGIFILFLILKFTIDGMSPDTSAVEGEAKVTSNILLLRNFKHVREVLKEDEEEKANQKVLARL